jgi:hypothetical protein
MAMRWIGAAAALGLALASGASAAAQDAGMVGGWRVKPSRSELDGAASLIASRPSTNSVSNSIGQPAVASLVVGCSKGRLAVMIMWPRYVGRSPAAVRYRIDDSGVRTANLFATTDAVGGAGGGESAVITRALATGHKMVVEVGGIEAVFDLDGAQDALPPILQLCGVTP